MPKRITAAPTPLDDIDYAKNALAWACSAPLAAVCDAFPVRRKSRTVGIASASDDGHTARAYRIETVQGGKTGTQPNGTESDEKQRAWRSTRDRFG